MKISWKPPQQLEALISILSLYNVIYISMRFDMQVGGFHSIIFYIHSICIEYFHSACLHKIFQAWKVLRGCNEILNKFNYFDGKEHFANFTATASWGSFKKFIMSRLIINSLFEIIQMSFWGLILLSLEITLRFVVDCFAIMRGIIFMRKHFNFPGKQLHLFENVR